jgi:hypothetical protein
MRKLAPLLYVVFACLFFLGYSLLRPNPSLFEIVVFVIIVAMLISGYSMLARSVIEIRDNRIAVASGPIAAFIGSLIILIPFVAGTSSNIRRIDGTCDISGRWRCVRCTNNDAELSEVSDGGNVRTMEMRQNGQKWPASFLFDKNLVFVPHLGPDTPGAIGAVSRDCKRIDWNYLWVWQREEMPE